MLKRLLQTNNNVFFSSRRFFQALYVSNKNIKKNVRILTPILDFKHRFTNPKVLADNLKRRGLSDQFNIDDLLAQWEIHSHIKAKKDEIECLLEETSKHLKEAKKGKTLQKREDEKRKYTLELETLRTDMQHCTNSLDEIELKFVNKFLSLPNELSNKTPQEAQVILSFGSITQDECAHHLVYDNVIEYFNNTTYYLKGDAAKFDHQFAEYCLNYFRKHGFVDFGNPDFAKTILVEGMALPLKKLFEVPHELNVHHTNLTHLVGNSSMLSFLGYLTQLLVWSSYLPIQWISAGQTYIRIDHDKLSLYNVCQTSNVQIFQAGTEEQMLEKFNETLKLIEQLFQKLDTHFRIVYTPAKDLNLAECLSAKIEMFSPHLKRYIEVGNLTHYSDYISKRLLFSYVKDRKANEIDFPHIVSGTVCNLTRTLAIILETYNGTVPKNVFDKFS
ncbi:serine--tRNA synthetase-like protein Slimp [Contarinia nasturtii]|uniref:serine--tRNA synthetase-like protein Slimp n=1 Tax=Contarinia nasturtii TaxID=265458 RepID=UPI0012D48D9C|nr:serine--tRNA synthetase-like protein Slimp [Contarinia nasturtii]